MFTHGEFIVGLWFVPVVLCIAVPLAMLSVWYCLGLMKRMTGKIEQLEMSVEEKQTGRSGKGLQAQTTA